jgi:DNA-binding transcriptional MerR regulator
VTGIATPAIKLVARGPLTVSDLGAELGLNAVTVRYYERLGAAPAAGRTAAGYSQYHQDAVQRLRFISSAQRVGLRLREIGELLAICDQGLCPCSHSEALLWTRMAEIDARWPNSRSCGPSWRGWSSGIRPPPAATRPRPAGGVRPPLPRRGGRASA